MPSILCPYDYNAPYAPDQEQKILLAAAFLREISGCTVSRAASTYERRFYVYALLEPNGRAGYIGKGESDRWMAHEKEARNPDNRTHKHKWIRRIWRDGERLLRCKVAENFLEDDAFALELELTEIIGLENLTNVSFGGKIPFAGMSYEQIKRITRYRAKLRKSRTKEKPATQYIQEVCARHPEQTVKELKQHLISNNIPWSSGREGTKTKDGMMTLIRQGADEMFAALGIVKEGNIKPARLFLQDIAISHPEWTADYCIAYTKEHGPDPEHKADPVIVSDMRGVLKKYAVVSEEAKYRVPLRAEDESFAAPDADPELEGVATGFVEQAPGKRLGGNWHPDLPEEVLEAVRKPRRSKP